MKKINIPAVVCTYNDPPHIFTLAMKNLSQQKRILYEVIVIDMSTNDVIKEICKQYPSIRYYYTPDSKNLSDSRNRGIHHARSKFVAFLDADAIPSLHWLYHIYTTFISTEKVAIVGGKIIPKWERQPSMLLKNSPFTDDFFSLLDLGEKTREVEKIIGANFALNKECFKTFFNIALGRGKVGQLGGEETDLCRRAHEANLRVYYASKAVVSHFVPLRKMRWQWLLYRAYYMGISRSLLKGKPNPYRSKKTFADLIFIGMILPAYIYGFMKGKLSQ